jgi:hypothetical protein
MASPKKSIPAYGSSRSTGGIFWGHAQGNTFNMADANDVWNDINPYDNKPAEKGKIGGLYTAPHSSGGLQLEYKYFFVFVVKQPILCL